jgi:hypothetical protein
MFRVGFFSLIFSQWLFAQTAVYKCVDSKDAKYWNYFNIDNNSLHFKEGNYTNIFNFKEVYFDKDIRTLIFTNGKFVFRVNHSVKNSKKLIVLDGRYSYECNLETILEEPKNKTPIIFK